MGSDSDGDDCEGVATLLAVAIAAFAKVSKSRYTFVVEDEDSRGLQHVVDVRDRRDRGEDNVVRVKRTCRVFPCPTYTASSACAEMLWCSEHVRVSSHEAGAFVDYFVGTLSKTICKIGFSLSGRF